MTLPVGFATIVVEATGARWLTHRTLRALGPEAPRATVVTQGAALARALGTAQQGAGALVLSAGCHAFGPLAPPPRSATAKPLCAVGAVDDPKGAWRAVLERTGGDLSGLPGATWEALPLGAVWLDPGLLPRVATSLAQGCTLNMALARLGRCRLVRHAPLDGALDPSLRVFQVVTSLQQGGAERVALELHNALRARGMDATLCTLGRPARPRLPEPEGLLDLSALRADPVGAAREAARVAVARGADLVHAHLLGSDAARALGERLPTVLTIHNARPGWPEGTEALRPGDCALVVGCAAAVSWDLARSLPGVPVRTAWNGVRPPPPAGGREACLERLNLHGSPWLLNVSNPRPQKALERLPAVLRALGEGARLALVGDQLGRTLPAREALGALERALESEGVTARVRRVDATEDVGAWLLAADVLVTPSAWEGLSLAWLEARALELPVVCTAVGGAEEVARGDPGVHLVPPEAPAEVFAQAVRAALEGGRSASPRREHFTVDAMARRYLSLYRRAADPVERGDTVWLVTNNFSVGGAQSSARRLLTGLAARGVAVRAATLQERPSRPTRGRLALAADGVPVLALAPPEEAGAEAAVEEFLGALREHPPRAVLLWNALAEHKVRIADALTAIPVFDVSPGEMYHQSLLRFFGHSRLPPGLPYTRPEDYGRLLRAVVVKHHAERAEAEALGAPVVVIPNGVPLPAAPPPPREATGVVLGTSARISAQKRLDLLLDAFERAARRVPGLSLRIAGGVERGQEAHAAELRARAGGLPVTFLGDVADIDGFLSGLDVFVMVSEPAGCPNASLEAMAQGLPLVVTDAGGAREQVVHGENGLVTGRHDPEALAEAIATLARAPALRERYGAASRDRLRARFSLPRMVNDYLALLSSEGPPGPRPEGGLTTPGP